jgi:hypothetical protein
MHSGERNTADQLLQGFVLHATTSVHPPQPAGAAEGTLQYGVEILGHHTASLQGTTGQYGL